MKKINDMNSNDKMNKPGLMSKSGYMKKSSLVLGLISIFSFDVCITEGVNLLKKWRAVGSDASQSKWDSGAYESSDWETYQAWDDLKNNKKCQPASDKVQGKPTEIQAERDSKTPGCEVRELMGLANRIWAGEASKELHEAAVAAIASTQSFYPQGSVQNEAFGIISDYMLHPADRVSDIKNWARDDDGNLNSNCAKLSEKSQQEGSLAEFMKMAKGLSGDSVESDILASADKASWRSNPALRVLLSVLKKFMGADEFQQHLKNLFVLLHPACKGQTRGLSSTSSTVVDKSAVTSFLQSRYESSWLAENPVLGTAAVFFGLLYAFMPVILQAGGASSAVVTASFCSVCAVPVLGVFAGLIIVIFF